MTPQQWFDRELACLPRGSRGKVESLRSFRDNVLTSPAGRTDFFAGLVGLKLFCDSMAAEEFKKESTEAAETIARAISIFSTAVVCANPELQKAK